MRLVCLALTMRRICKGRLVDCLYTDTEDGSTIPEAEKRAYQHHVVLKAVSSAGSVVCL